MNDDNILYDTIYNDEDIKYNKDKPLWFIKWQQKFYHSKEWIKLRNDVINNVKHNNKGLIVSDVSHNIILTTVIVDHIKPVTIYNYMDSMITLNVNNLQVMSKEEHYQKHYGKDNKEYNNETEEDIVNKLLIK